MPLDRGDGTVHETNTDEGVVTMNDRLPGGSGAFISIVHTHRSIDRISEYKTLNSVRTF